VDQSRLEPVKIVFERRVRPGAEPQFEQWACSFMTTASRFPGLQGSSAFNFSSTGDYFILLRFASQAHLENWRNAREVRALCKQADAVSTATDRHQVRTGLETWFALTQPVNSAGSSASLEDGARYLASVVSSGRPPFTSDSVSTSDAHPCCAVDGRSGGYAHLACDAAPVGIAPRMAIRCSNCLSDPERTPR
jgi:heme-degrading monooxygenase HmoA